MRIIQFTALILSFFAVYGWFNPKYRYNEHSTWNPNWTELFLIWGIILIIWAAIIKG